MTSITAGAVAVEEMSDINTFVVVFAQNGDGSDRLEIQRALSFDEQDRQSGMDTYCLCLASGATHYGGVESWRLDEGGLELRLAGDAAEELGVEGVVRVDIQMAPAVREKVAAGLARALGDVPRMA
jgi:hypothetical protein